jgi:hypothetical protein
MRRLLGLLATTALSLAIGFSAGARPLNFDGTLSTQTSTTLPLLHNTLGGVATVNNSAGAIPSHLQTLRLAASRLDGDTTQMVAITDPTVSANGIASLRITASLATGTLGPISGGAASTTVLTKNVLPVRGLSKVCLLATTCTNFLPLQLTQHVATSMVKGVGIGGLLTIGAGTNPIRISIEAAPWTIKTATVIDQITTPMTPMGIKKFINVSGNGFAHDPSSTTTSTAQPSGVVQLISPMQIVTNLTSGSNQKLSQFSTLRIHFIPEPGLLLLLGAGVAGLALLGRQRMRK